MHMYSSPDETMSNKRDLRKLIEDWSRPILGLETDYRRLGEIEEAAHEKIRKRAKMLSRYVS